ncbi:hypothetical protein JYU34_011715 [Plutella xylostella]|uniref:ABC transporter domain-containing protein n=1 Tax=Plutella xylostella TaxID=51655 RepID=A0ABQ7QH20_PLUXY|nr:hypothetical protein JYU34_011715 [Plutella xylostella]
MRASETNARSDANDMHEIRQMIGVCPQQDVLFDLLSVKEHLQFFAAIKGIPRKTRQHDVSKALAEVGLSDQAGVFSKHLSGGQKRKLSIAIALIGDPKIIILDEPTAGVDPVSRRQMWRILQRARRGKVLLLTTHFMDEADILGDRKAVISKGRVRCAGTSLFLKNKFGIGYHLTLVLDGACREHQITRMVRGHVPRAEKARRHGRELSYILPHYAAHLFPPLFHAIEHEIKERTNRLGITSYGVSMTTLEEVFLSLEGENTEEMETEGVSSVKLVRARALSRSLSLQSKTLSYQELNDKDSQQKATSLPTPPASHALHSTNHGVEHVKVTPAEAPLSVDVLGEIVKTKPSCWRTFCALVYIRTVRMIRDPYKLYVMIFMPIISCALGLYMKSKQIVFFRMQPLKLDPNAYLNRTPIALHNDGSIFKEIVDLRDSLETLGANPIVDFDGNFSSFLNMENFGAYSIKHSTMPYGNILAYYNSTYTHSLPIIINMLDNSIYRVMMSAAGYLESFKPIEVYTHPFQQTEQQEEFNVGNVVCAIFMGMIFALVPVTLAVDIVYDREAANQGAAERESCDPPASISVQHYDSAPDLRLLLDTVTERKKRKFDHSDSNIIDVMKEMFNAFARDQDARFERLQTTISNLKEQNNELTLSVELMSSKYDEFLVKISELESERKKDKEAIYFLEDKIEYLERKSKSTGIEIRNLPKKTGETKKDLCSLIQNFGNSINVDMNQSCVKDIYRIRSKDASNPILVEFTTVIQKETVLENVKAFNKTKKIGEKLNTGHFLIQGPIKAKNQLRVNGLSMTMYFLTYFTILIVIMIITSIGVLVLVNLNDIPSLTNGSALTMLSILLLLYSPSAILFNTCLSYIFDKMDSAQSIMPNITTWVGVIPFILVAVLDTFKWGSDIAFYLHLVFSFLNVMYIPYAIIYYVDRVYMTCNLRGVCTTPALSAYLTGEVCALVAAMLLHIPLGVAALRLADRHKSTGRLCAKKKATTSASDAEDVEAEAAGEGEDEDVRKERRRVLASRSSRAQPSPVLLLHNLRKEYKVRGTEGGCCGGADAAPGRRAGLARLSLAVEGGEVFGLLGHNGAGKTTTMKIITAEEQPTRGEVILGGESVSGAQSSAFELLGYCPQHDALWKNVTIREHLECYAAIRGVSKSDAPRIVEAYLNGLQIMEHANKNAEECSGGTRRKLSFALAMVGNPRVVLLDEPSTGMDPRSKRFLWDTILASFQGKKGAILTTHSMEEADALCSRVGIMVKGGLRCIGSTQHLKNLYGAGYTLEMKIGQPYQKPLESDMSLSPSPIRSGENSPSLGEADEGGSGGAASAEAEGEAEPEAEAVDISIHTPLVAGTPPAARLTHHRTESSGGASAEAAIALVSQMFPAAVLEENFADRLVFSVPQRSVSSLANCFQRIEEAKEKLNIVEYSFSQTTLEQVFLKFAQTESTEQDQDC